MPRATAAPETPSVVINQTVASTEKPERAAEKPKPDFWTYLKSLSPQDWKSRVVYLYRTRPIVGNKQKEKYLDVYSGPFTIDDVKNRFGGEEFRAMLLKDGRAEMNEEFCIEAAPKYDLAREIPGTEASQTAMVRDLVDKLTTRAPESNPSTDIAMSKSIDMLSTAFETALTKIAGTAGGSDSMRDPFTLIRMMKDLGLIGQPQNNLRDAIVLLKELGLLQQQSQPVNRIQEFKDLVSAVKEISGDLASEAAPQNWKTRLVDKVAEVAPALISNIGGMMEKQAQIERERTHRAQIITQARTVPDAVQQPLTAPAQIPAVNPDPSVAGEPIRTVPLNHANAQPAAVQTETVGQPSQEWLSKRVFAAIQGEQSGESVIDFLDVANPAITQYFSTLTKEQIKNVFASDYILKSAIALPNFEQWLDEAYTYLHDNDENQASAKPN